MIVLISGKQGSGKTTLATNLRDLWHEVPNNRAFIMKFASPLYDMHNFILGYLADHGIKRDMVKDGPLLQLLGTEWGRKTVSENIWVDLLKAKIKKSQDPSRSYGARQLFIIEDCRFRNEFDAFPDAVKIRLECSLEARQWRCEAWRPNDTHESEMDLDGYSLNNKFDLTFDTTKTLDAAMVAHASYLHIAEKYESQTK